MSGRIPALPALFARKLYKTGQTRGADDDEIFQNRVLRTSTVLIPYSNWDLCASAGVTYENGFIVLLSPTEYFDNKRITRELTARGLTLGKNLLVFYETRQQWTAHNPDAIGWTTASQRIGSLGGQYVARVSANTSTDGGKINRGFTTTSMKGAGVRAYEYASSKTIEACRVQLESLFWLCRDSLTVAADNGMTSPDAKARRAAILENCKRLGLLDIPKLTKARIVDAKGVTVCPLCLEALSSRGFFERMAQAEGRVVLDLTVTELNLFHIEELRYGKVNHRPYNIGWGHHHCNVVVKDAGILETLEWMKRVVQRNKEI